MHFSTFPFLLALLGASASPFHLARATDAAQPFGPDFPALDSAAVGEWWKRKPNQPALNLNVPRDEVVAFAIYTHENGVLKLTAQLYPLMPNEPREARLAAIRAQPRP